MRAIILSLALVAAVAFADSPMVTVTETRTVTVLHSLDGTTSKPFKTHQECVDAIPIDSKNVCWDGFEVVKTGKCPDAPKDANGDPVFPAGTVVEGVATQCPNDDTRWYTRVTGFVSHYPSCNVVGLVPEAPPSDCSGPLPPYAWEQGTVTWVPPVEPCGLLDSQGNPVNCPPPATPPPPTP